VHNIIKSPYGHPASTVFGLREKNGYSPDYDEDDDPMLTHLRFLDYRYIRFCFHPLKDKFVLCSDWKDPNWTDVKSIRAGLDSDERLRREQVFGANEIEIERKSIPRLLIDEVSVGHCEQPIPR
jgi:cation-transporting ATPase 13A3/4/5